MKCTFLTTAILCSLFSFCTAQITLQSGDLPTVPAILYNGVDTLPSGINEGMAGANQVWDFSGVAQHIIDTVQHQTAAASGYGGNFPTATNAITTDGISYAFFRNSSSAYTGQGLAGDLLGNGNIYVVNFSPTFDLYQFPTQYGGNFTGNYGFQQTAPGSAVNQPVDQVRVTFTSTYFDTIDGYGTTITPIGSYNSLRQKRVEQTRTLIEFKLFSFSQWAVASDDYDTTFSYNYLALESQGPVVTLGRDSLDNINRVTYSLAPPNPIADFSYNNPYGGLVQFTDESSNSPTTWSWDFGDGSTSNQQSPSHTYAANGNYNVCLTVTNSAGSNTTCQTVTVDGYFTTSISGPNNLCNNEANGVVYAVTNRTDNTYNWNVNGGAVASGNGTASITVNWSGAAPYSVSVIECDGTGNYCNGDTLAVTILPASITNLTETICQGEDVAGYTTTGIYVDTFTAINGCDSIRTLNLTVNPTYTFVVDSNVCFGVTVYSYSISGQFIDTLSTANGCDSIRTLNLTVLPENSTLIDTTVCFGESVLGYNTSGIYKDTFTAANGCDSIRTLDLTVRNEDAPTLNITICPGSSYAGYTSPGTYVDSFTNRFGCDSTRTLILDVQANVRDTVDRQICFGTTYLGYAATGTYSDTFSISGCDSIRVLNLTVLQQNTDSVYITICDGDSYAGYSTNGTYIDIFTDQNNCDSTRTLFLTVLPNAVGTVDTTICFNTTFEGYGATGTYVDTFTAANSCDSVRTLSLTVLPQNQATINQTICDGETFEGYGTSGTFTDIFTGSNSCDSSRILNLTVLPGAVTNLDTTICYNSSFEGYDMTGVFSDTFPAANGCDSIRVLNLTVRPLAVSNVTDSICLGDNLFGYNSTGVYTDTLTSSTGCDSVRVLNLIVEPERSIVNVTICEGDSVFAGGEWQTTTGSYFDTLIAGNCTEIIGVKLSVTSPNIPTIVQNGTDLSVPSNYATYTWYQDTVKIDTITGALLANATVGNSYYVVVADSNGCIATSNTITVMDVGIIRVNHTDQFSYYPNPTTGVLNIQSNSKQLLNVALYNAFGELLMTKYITGMQSLQIDLNDQAQGIYLLKVSTTKYSRVEKVLIVR